MFISLKASMNKGDTFFGKLTFERAGIVVI